MADTQMTVPGGSVELLRPHTPPASPLRAWSAADMLVLDHLANEELGRVLVINDEFGALTTALASANPVVWTDSALSRDAIAANLKRNRAELLTEQQLIRGDQMPTGVFDTIIIRIPKTAALLDYQLRVARGCATGSTRVVGTGMVRHIHNSTLASFEALIGTTTTSLATRKARLIHTNVTTPVPDAVSSPGQLDFTEFTTSDGFTVAELPGTFSAGHLDVGTSLLLEVLRWVPEPTGGSKVIDLGCGNGIVAAALAKRWSGATFELLDVSDLAVAAARITWERNGLGQNMTARVVDGFDGTPDESVDVVVTNPPFHQGHALDRDMTDRLLAEAARVLTAEGVAYVVVQRHLNLHASMVRWFESVEVISKHPSHVVLEARSPKR